MDYLVTVWKKGALTEEAVFTHRLFNPADGFMSGFVKGVETCHPKCRVTCDEIK